MKRALPWLVVLAVAAVAVYVFVFKSSPATPYRVERGAVVERRAAVLVVTHDHRSLDLVHRSFEIEDGFLKT